MEHLYEHLVQRINEPYVREAIGEFERRYLAATDKTTEALGREAASFWADVLRAAAITWAAENKDRPGMRSGNTPAYSD